jgi:cytochrome c oxidase cbb3-type subunit II
MRMNPDVLIVGSLLVFAAVVGVVVVLPGVTITDQPSDIYRDRTDLENQGRDIYVSNGCTYCHSQAIRQLDWGLGAERVAQAGDYISEQPHLLGSERTGPDLSQEGGEHPDDWHDAHFFNPRHVRPESIMPSFTFLTEEKNKALIAYVQSLGFKDADIRVERQRKWKVESSKAFEAGTDANVEWLHNQVPQGWRDVPNPYPTTEAGLERGKRIYQGFCIGCHGEVGDGMGPAHERIYPPPFNFTTLTFREITGGILYYQIMNGITGTAMPYFKRELESEKIWDVGNYIAVNFIGVTDADAEPKGIDAAYETHKVTFPDRDP